MFLLEHSSLEDFAVVGCSATAAVDLLSIAVALLAEFQAFPQLSPSLKDNVKLSTLRKGPMDL